MRKREGRPGAVAYTNSWKLALSAHPIPVRGAKPPAFGAVC